MLGYFILMSICVGISYYIDRISYEYDSVSDCLTYNILVKILYYAMLTAMILFAGLRTWFNDTFEYIAEFDSYIPGDIVFSILHYQGWLNYNVLVKTFISSDSQIFLIVSAAIMSFLYINYIVKHGYSFVASVFIFFAGTYLSSMAGMKQVMAIGIVLYAIDYYLEEKYLYSILIVLLAMSFHPSVICLCAIVCLGGEPWNKKTLFIAVVMALAVVNIGYFLGYAADIAKTYTVNAFDNGHTINPFRVVVEAVPVLLSYIYKEKLAEENDEKLNLFINMQLISFVFIAISLVYNPIYFGRMAGYFGCLYFIMLPKMLDVCFGVETGQMKKVAYYCFILVYFIADFSKLGLNTLDTDMFMHVNLFDFIEFMLR